MSCLRDYIDEKSPTRRESFQKAYESFKQDVQPTQQAQQLVNALGAVQFFHGIGLAPDKQLNEQFERLVWTFQQYEYNRHLENLNELHYNLEKLKNRTDT